MAEIITESKLVDIGKSTIERILRVVPEEDLTGLKEIWITDEWPPGDDAFYDPNRKMVGVCVRRALENRGDQGRNVMEEIAFDIFHEIAHHVQERDHRWDDFTKSDGLGKITHKIDRTELYLAYEQFANSYADEKLEKLRQADPETLSLDSRTRSLVQTRLESVEGVHVR